MRDKEVHSFAQVTDAFDELLGFFSAVVEQRDDLGEGRRVRVPFLDYGFCSRYGFVHGGLSEDLVKRRSWGGGE